MTLTFSSFQWNMFTGSGHCNSTIDHNFSPRTGDWFHETIHVTGNFHHDQETGQEESWNFFFHESTLTRNLDVYHFILLWCFGCNVSCLSFFTTWMEIWGNINWSFNFEWFFPLQQPLVLSWSNHATELWRLPQVWHHRIRQCTRSTLRPSFQPYNLQPSLGFPIRRTPSEVADWKCLQTSSWFRYRERSLFESSKSRKEIPYARDSNPTHRMTFLYPSVHGTQHKYITIVVSGAESKTVDIMSQEGAEKSCCSPLSLLPFHPLLFSPSNSIKGGSSGQVFFLPSFHHVLSVFNHSLSSSCHRTIF